MKVKQHVGQVVKATQDELEAQPSGSPSLTRGTLTLFAVMAASPSWVVVALRQQGGGRVATNGASPDVIGYLRRSGCEIKRTKSAVLARWPWQTPSIKPIELREVWDSLSDKELDAVRSLTGLDVKGVRARYGVATKKSA